MNNRATKPTGPTFSDLAPVLDGETLVAPCPVVAVTAGEPEVQLPSGERVRARMALAYVYAPAVGDQLLVIGREDRHFVIGVVQTQGALRLDFPGDVQLRSAGDLHLDAGGELRVQASAIDMEASTVRLVADAVVESARELYTKVSDVLSVRAGTKREHVRGEWTARADKATITTDADVSVNGEQIRLG